MGDNPVQARIKLAGQELAVAPLNLVGGAAPRIRNQSGFYQGRGIKGQSAVFPYRFVRAHPPMPFRRQWQHGG